MAISKFTHTHACTHAHTHVRRNTHMSKGHYLIENITKNDEMGLNMFEKTVSANMLRNAWYKRQLV